MYVQCASNVRPTYVQCMLTVLPPKMARACRREHRRSPCDRACLLRGVLGPGLPGAAQASHPRGICASALPRSSVGVDIHAVRALPTTSVLVDLAACCQASLALLIWQPRIGHTRPRLSGLPPATDVPAYLETPYGPNLRLLARGFASSPNLDSLIWQWSAG